MLFRQSKNNIATIIGAALSIAGGICYSHADAFVPTGSRVDPAKLTEVHGAVIKQIPLTQQAFQLAPPIPAKLGDRLPQGSHLYTGKKSWAQVTWPDIVARAWSNSVFSISPNRRLIYVSEGEVLIRLNKNRKNKDEYVVVTKFVQARVHGTTILVQANRNGSRVAVLEGNIAAVNRIDKNVIDISPGLVYEVRQTNPAADVTAHDSLSLEGLAVNVPRSISPVEKTDIIAEHLKPMHVFVETNEQTNLYAADVRSLLHHPLLQGFTNELDSKPLIDNAISNLPTELKIPVSDKPNSEDIPEALLNSARIEMAPEIGAYKIGHDVDDLLPHDADTFIEHRPAGELAPSDLPQPDAPLDAEPASNIETTPQAEGTSPAGKAIPTAESAPTASTDAAQSTAESAPSASTDAAQSTAESAPSAPTDAAQSTAESAPSASTDAAQPTAESTPSAPTDAAQPTSESASSAPTDAAQPTSESTPSAPTDAAQPTAESAPSAPSDQATNANDSAASSTESNTPVPSPEPVQPAADLAPPPEPPAMPEAAGGEPGAGE